MVIVLAAVFLAENNRIVFSTEMVLLITGFVFGIAGAIVDLTGEMCISREYKAYLNSNDTAVFQKVKPQKSFTLENQNGKISKFCDNDIEDFLEEMFISTEQFVVLTAPAPEQRVRFVQACMEEDKVNLQLGIEENETSLVYKLCSKEECRRIFLEFYHDRFVPDDSEYRMVTM